MQTSCKIFIAKESNVDDKEITNVPSLGKDLHQIVGEISAGQVETQDGVWKGVTFVDWNRVGNAVARVEHDTRRASRGVQRQHCLDGDVHRLEGQSNGQR